jgi:signal transduction histidine kinase
MAALRLEPSPAEATRVEGVLAHARAGVVLFCLVAVAIQRPSPSGYAPLARGVVVAYLLQSVALLLILRTRWTLRGLAVAVTVLDLSWAAVISLLTGGPNSPFFGLFVFAILSAAYRWGLRATLTTAGVTVAVLLAEVAAMVAGGAAGAGLLRGALELDLVITRCAYVLIGGLLLGYMAQTEKDLRAETAAVARLVVKVRAEAGLSATLEEVSRELLTLFGAGRLLLVMHGMRTQRLFVWDTAPGGAPEEVSVRSEELDAAQRETYLFRAPAGAWAARRRGEAAPEVTVVDREGRALREAGHVVPADFLERCPFRTLLAVSLTFREEWEDRVYLVDPEKAGPRELRLLQAFVRQAGPILYNVYLLGRLRARVRTVERARVARDLHDGVIQSLIGVEMEVDALRRETGPSPARLAARLAEVQQVLRAEVAGLRELMIRMKPIYLDPHRLPEYLVDLVDRFRRETGIAAHFSCELDEVALRPRVCTELARIVQEALANVRKHSGAKNVLVRFDGADGQWKLSVDDDGCGFRFAGRLSLAELDAGRLGPMVIKERVRSIGGQLTIDSSPGGSRLEVTLPRAAGA